MCTYSKIQNKCEKKSKRVQRYAKKKKCVYIYIYTSKYISDYQRNTSQHISKNLSKEISKKHIKKKHIKSSYLWIPTSVVGMWTSITWTRASRQQTQVRTHVQPKKSDTKICHHFFCPMCTYSKIQHIVSKFKVIPCHTR